MPAYLTCIILSLRFFTPILNYKKLLIISITTIVATTLITHSILLIKYHYEMSVVLNEIKNSPKTIICISPDDTIPTRIPLLDLSQANMIVDWGDPEPIYQKEIRNCE